MSKLICRAVLHLRCAPQRSIADSAVSRHREADGSVVEIHSDGSRRKLPTAKISLQDCLACRFATQLHSLGDPSLCTHGCAVAASHRPKACSSSK